MAEYKTLKVLFMKYQSGEFENLDGYDILLLDTVLLNVWIQYKNVINVCDDGIVLKRTMEMGLQMVQSTIQIKYVIFKFDFYVDSDS